MSVFLDEAVAVGERLLPHARPYKDRLVWVGRDVPESGDSGQVMPRIHRLPPTLHMGAAGIALFYHRLAAAAGEERYAHVARRSIEDALALSLAAARLPAAQRPSWARGQRNGLYSGTLGVAWAAHEVSGDDPRVRVRVGSLVKHLHRTRASHHLHDLMGGNAGAIGPLLRLADDGIPLADDLARYLAKDLAAELRRAGHQGAMRPVSPAWRGGLTGLSHGTSGAAVGLAWAGRRFDDPDLVRAATEALDYEARHFVPEQRNWADLRVDVSDGLPVPCESAWCHGAPGIGVARTLLDGLLPGAFDEDVGHAVHSARKRLALLRDHPTSLFILCHGTPGVAECIDLVQGGNETMRAVAREGIERFGQEVRRESGDPFIDWPLAMPGVIELGMMKGLAGVGQFLLRSHDRDVPSMLTPPAPDAI